MLIKTIELSDLQPYDVLCYEKTSIIGRIIQILNRSKFNHTSNLDKGVYLVQVSNGLTQSKQKLIIE